MPGRQGSWWVAKEGLLTTGNDPTGELSNAGDQFPDEYVPKLFMTGDGHRRPPFQWVDRGVWPAFFGELIDDNVICCHVEKYSDEVTRDCVPESLASVYDNGKVFGWEPDFFKVVGEILALWVTTAPKQFGQILTEDATKFIGWALGVPSGIVHLADVRQQVEVFAGVLAGQVSDKDKYLPPHMGASFQGVLKKYYEAGYRLRTEIHDIVGRSIQAVINRYPGDFHLITCGDAHIRHNPLFTFITPPPGCFGVADVSSH